MQKQKCSLALYTNFLIANHNRYSGTELAKVAPTGDIHHDAVSRWLSSSSFNPSDLWNQVKPIVRKDCGYLIGDDTLLDKRYSRQNELAKKQYSGKEHGIVNGINLVNLLWADADQMIPVDYRAYQKEIDGKTKNDHFRDMLNRAKQRQFSPLYVLMDSWYSSVENLKHIRKKDWHFICSLASNRQVHERQSPYVPVADLSLADKEVRKVWLKEYGYVLVSKAVATNGDVVYLATDDLTLADYEPFIEHWNHRWDIEEFHRGIKQTTGIEKCYSTLAASQKTHIFSAFVAFVKLEKNRLLTRLSWYEQKAQISRMAASYHLKWANA